METEEKENSVGEIDLVNSIEKGLSNAVVGIVNDCTGFLRESSQLLSNKIMQKRVRNLIEIFCELEKMAAQKGLSIDSESFFEMNGIKFITKFVEEASLSDREFKIMWANLLASKPKETDLKSEIAETLSHLDVELANKLHEIAEVTSHARAHYVLKRRKDETRPSGFQKWSPYHFRLEDVIDTAVKQVEELENQCEKSGEKLDKKNALLVTLKEKGVFVYAIKDSEILGDFARVTNEEKTLLRQLYRLSRYDLITYANKTAKINGWFLYAIVADLTEYGKDFLDAVSDGGYEFFDTFDVKQTKINVSNILMKNSE